MRERLFMVNDYAEHGDFVQAAKDFRIELLREGRMSEIEGVYEPFEHPRLESDRRFVGARVRWQDEGEGV